MNRPKYHVTLNFFLIALVVSLLALASQTPSPAQAGAGLPARETPVPPPPADDDKKDEAGPPVGAYVELAAPGAPVGAWTVIQWHCPSDGRSTGGWREVEGWQGAPTNSSRWWVHPKDFGTGPFRWLVMTGPGGAEWAASASFYLPGQPNETLRVEVSP